MTISTISRSKKVIRGLLAAAFWAAVWQGVSMAVDLPLLLPGPWQVLQALGKLSLEKEFWGVVGLTLLRILCGFALGSAAGFILAVLTEFVPAASVVLAPAIRVVRATPVASFILLCMLWMKSTVVAGFIAGLMVLPVIWGNVAEGFAQTEVQFLELADVYRMGRWKTFRLIYLPSVRPYFRAACITALGMAWKSGVAAEVLCQPRLAIGTQLYYAKIYLETENLFAWTAVVVLLSVGMEHLFIRLVKEKKH